MKYLKFLITGLFIGGLCGAAIFNKCSSPQQPTNIIDTVTIVDTFPEPYAVSVPEIIYRDTGSTKFVHKTDTFEVTIPVDTNAIIQDYLSIKSYNFDTTINEVMVREDISLFANQILNRTFVLTNTRKRTELAPRGFSAGSMLGYHEISLLGGYTHNNFTYLLGYNIYENQVKVGFIYKLNFNQKWKKN